MRAHERFWEERTADPDDEDFLSMIPSRFTSLVTSPKTDGFYNAEWRGDWK